MKILRGLFLGLVLLMVAVAALPLVQDALWTAFNRQYEERNAALEQAIFEANAESAALLVATDVDLLYQAWDAQQQQALANAGMAAAARVVLTMVVVGAPFLLIGAWMVLVRARRLEAEHQEILRQIHEQEIINARLKNRFQMPQAPGSQVASDGGHMPPPSPLARRQHFDQKQRRSR